LIENRSEMTSGRVFFANPRVFGGFYLTVWRAFTAAWACHRGNGPG
jgi:hypothetical protein